VNDRLKLWLVIRRALHMVIAAVDEFIGFAKSDK
jgi:hypothetical protein